MTITFRVPPGADDRIGFTYSPLLETVLSLHVLAEPKHHPLQHAWVRRMRRLPVGLRREITTLSFTFREYFPAFCFPSAHGPQASFAQEIERLRALPHDQVREEFAVALVGDVARGQGGVPPDSASGPEADDAVRRTLAEDPGALLERFVSLLGDYWEAAFAEEWERLSSQLADTMTEIGEELAVRGLFGPLRRLAPEVGSDPVDRRFWLDRPHDHEVTLSAEDRLTLVPSVYVWPHVRVNCDPPWPLGVVFPVSHLQRAAHVSMAPPELIATLRAVAEETRLRLLRLLAQRPRSTEELAPLLHLTPAALSKHLRVLARAGLVTTRRDGYYVLYSADRDRLAALAPSLHTYVLGTGGGRDGRPF
ncbi:helix-turn-helix transcriptional regulator [Streptomyces sp. S3(2020)]|uniref:DUF5937 family protein n=1 Tax=Streptomyces sp. S3(2020) TaxID=2732044 RepID=UPI0014883A86|nr:helix-turn-helix transcriptional regulator [Streptomyces sp. S3(2020)]